MENLDFNLTIRGQFLKLLLLFALAFFSFKISLNADSLLGAPNQVSKNSPFSQVMKNLNEVKFKVNKQLPLVFKLISIGFILFAGYIALIARTTIISCSKINLSLTRGILIRRKDALDMTGILDFSKTRTLLDIILGTAHFKIVSRDKSHPQLTFEGVTKKNADFLYDHLIAYSNKSMVEYVQGYHERANYNRARKSPKDKAWTRQAIDDESFDDGSDN